MLTSLVVLAQLSMAESLLLRGGVVHVGNGEVVTKDLLIQDGKLADPGQAPTGTRIINLEGQHVYPGLIAPDTELGLVETDAVRASRDSRDVATFDPSLRAYAAYNVDSEVIPTVRSNGVLTAQVAPKSGVISGLSSVMQFRGWTREEAAYQVDDALWMNWAWSAELEGFMSQALSYLGLRSPFASRWEAMVPSLQGERKVFIRVQSAREILEALAFGEKYSLDLVLVDEPNDDQPQSYLVKEEIAAAGVPVILSNISTGPDSEDSHIHQNFRTPADLRDAGVTFALSAPFFGGNTRNLPFLAAMAASHGLTDEEALRSITLTTAEILGLEESLGSLEVGKDATLIVSQGDLLEITESDVTLAFIGGELVDLGDKHKELYEKYKNRPKKDLP